MSSKKKRRPGRKPARSIPKHLRTELEEVDTLIRRHRWEEARDLLEDLDRRFPNRTEVVSGLASVYQQLGDTQQLQPVCARLSKLFPQDPDILLSLAGAYLNNGRVLLAQRTFQQVLNRWPTHRLAEKARRTVAE